MHDRTNPLQVLRAYWGLCQVDLGYFLRVSRTLLAHAEANRRHLPIAAWQRIIPLLPLLPPPFGPATPPPARDAVETAPAALKPLHTRLRDCRWHIARLRHELKQLRACATPCRRRLLDLPAVRATLPTPLSDLDEHWLELMAAEAAAELRRSGAVAQGLLEARIAALEAEAAALEALLATLLPPQAAPEPGL